MEDAAKLEKLARGSPSDKTRSDSYFSQILGDIEALENVNSASPVKQASCNI